MPSDLEAILRAVQSGSLTTTVAGELLRALQARVATPAPLQLFEEVWAPADAPAPRPGSGGSRVWLLSDPRHQQIILELTREAEPAARTLFVRQGEHFAQEGPGLYVVPAGDEAALRLVLEDAAAPAGVDAVAYAWPLEDAARRTDPAAVAALLRAVLRTAPTCERVLLAGVYADDLQRCHLESWIGFARSLPAVSPTMAVALAAFDNAGPAALDGAWRELRADRFESSLTVGGRRQVCRTRPLEPQAGKGPLRRGGVYLITGGAGGLGRVFARHLSANFAARLLLVGRSPPDNDRAALLEALADLGGQALYQQADVIDPAALRAAIEAAEARFGPLDGVIHAAGVIGLNGTLLERSPEDFARVVAPKIAGLLALEDALAGRRLDFVCHFASAAAVLGDLGACDYAVANRFLMARAAGLERRRAAGEAVAPTRAINWGPWDVGMTAGQAALKAIYLAATGQRVLAPQDGATALRRALEHDGPPNLLALAGRPQGVRALIESRTVCATTSPQGGDGDPALSSVSDALSQAAAELLKLDPADIGRHRNFADLGFDSVMVAKFARLATIACGLEISPATVFNHSSLARLETYISGRRVAAGAPGEASRPSLPRALGRSAESRQEPIAVIGVSGRFPGARTVDALWDMLARGGRAIHEAPPERFGGWWPEAGPRWCGLAPGVAEFDADFFETPPAEAEAMDPRHRLLLQESWRALEDAGLGGPALSACRVGTFIGAEQGDYQVLGGGRGSLTANHEGVLAARLAYVLDLQGPAMAINTACSSGLVALHQACLSLRQDECDVALAGAVNLFATPAAHALLHAADMLSADGRCCAFGDDASGMVPSEAVVVVVLTPLSRALAQGDPIRAVIRASAINHDGRTNGLTAPSAASQLRLMREAYRRGGVTPEDIDYVVAHGTGTKVGDAVEAEALTELFGGESASPARRVAVTSCKPNLGHTLAASGLVSLVTLVEALRHETIPRSLECDEPNSYVDWAACPLDLNRQMRPWPRSGRIRRGAVSAFGMSGTNAHVVVEESPLPDVRTAAPRPMLIALSAKTEAALLARAEDLAAHLDTRVWSAADLQELEATLAFGRRHLDWRLAVVAEDADAAAQLLRAHNGVGVVRGHVPRNPQLQPALQAELQAQFAQAGDAAGDPHDIRDALAAAAELYCSGYDLALGPPAPARRIHLPTYPFARTSFWSRPRTRQDVPWPELQPTGSAD